MVELKEVYAIIDVEEEKGTYLTVYVHMAQNVL